MLMSASHKFSCENVRIVRSWTALISRVTRILLQYPVELPLNKRSHHMVMQNYTVHTSIAVSKERICFLYGNHHLHNASVYADDLFSYYFTGGTFHLAKVLKDTHPGEQVFHQAQQIVQ